MAKKIDMYEPVFDMTEEKFAIVRFTVRELNQLLTNLKLSNADQVGIAIKRV